MFYLNTNYPKNTLFIISFYKINKELESQKLKQVIKLALGN
jgi:hypothetical protein